MQQQTPFETDPQKMWKQFGEQTTQWFNNAFKDKLPEQLKPHFQTYLNMMQLFTNQWENLEGMIRHGLTDPKTIWQWVDAGQYADAVGRVMGFKPIGDLDQVMKESNRFFEQMRAAAMKMFPAAEEQMIEVQEAMHAFTQEQTDQLFPFLQSMQGVMHKNLEPYFHTTPDDMQTKVLRHLKDMQFAYMAYLQHTSRMQKMVLDAGAKVLPEMMQEIREEYLKDGNMPEFDTFFPAYMDRLEAAIVEVMHEPAYSTVQNQVLEAGTRSKVIYDDLLELLFKDWPFLTKREADDLIKETATLRRRIRKLERQISQGPVARQAKSTPEEDLLTKLGAASQEDDLTEIKGVGKKLAQLLADLGIRSFAQVARMDDETYATIDALIPAFKGRAKRDAWAKQAHSLMHASSIA